MTPRIYLIPGMGCDKRLFSELALHLDFTVIEFLQPQAGEPLEHYAVRMAEGIDKTVPFMIGGVSFGGMLSAEIAKICKPAGVIFISTAKTRREVPFWLRTLRWIPIHRLMSAKMLKALWPRSPFPREEKFTSLMLSMKREADLHLFKWSINAATLMSNRVLPPKFIHLHGTRDLLLPGMFIRGAIKIRKGDHGIVMAHAEEVAEKVKVWMEGLP